MFHCYVGIFQRLVVPEMSPNGGHSPPIHPIHRTWLAAQTSAGWCFFFPRIRGHKKCVCDFRQQAIESAGVSRLRLPSPVSLSSLSSLSLPTPRLFLPRRFAMAVVAGISQGGWPSGGQKRPILVKLWSFHQWTQTLTHGIHD